MRTKKQEAEFARKLADEIAKVNAEHEQLSSGTQNSESTGVKIAAPEEDAAPATSPRLKAPPLLTTRRRMTGVTIVSKVCVVEAETVAVCYTCVFVLIISTLNFAGGDEDE